MILVKGQTTALIMLCVHQRRSVDVSNGGSGLALSARDGPLYGSSDALYIFPHATNRCASFRG